MLRKIENEIGKIKVISKYLFFSSLCVFLSFLFFDYLNAKKLYENPKKLILHNITFEVRRAPKGSESRIVIYGDAGQIFSSSCYGLEKIVCDKKEFFTPRKATTILAIELSHKKGILKKIEMHNSFGQIEFENTEAEIYIQNFSKNIFVKNKSLFFVCVFFSAIFSILKFLSKKISKENKL